WLQVLAGAGFLPSPAGRGTEGEGSGGTDRSPGTDRYKGFPSPQPAKRRAKATAQRSGLAAARPLPRFLGATLPRRTPLPRGEGLHRGRVGHHDYFKWLPTFTIFMVFVPPDCPMGSPMVSTMRSPCFTTPASTSTCSASASRVSRSLAFWYCMGS